MQICILTYSCYSKNLRPAILICTKKNISKSAGKMFCCMAINFDRPNRKTPVEMSKFTVSAMLNCTHSIMLRLLGRNLSQYNNGFFL